jgi:hypothetical protein
MTTAQKSGRGSQGKSSEVHILREKLPCASRSKRPWIALKVSQNRTIAEAFTEETQKKDIWGCNSDTNRDAVGCKHKSQKMGDGRTKATSQNKTRLVSEKGWNQMA